jgi:hypothetical protein
MSRNVEKCPKSMEDWDLGHPLKIGAFCGAFSVVSEEICAI